MGEELLQSQPASETDFLQALGKAPLLLEYHQKNRVLCLLVGRPIGETAGSTVCRESWFPQVLWIIYVFSCKVKYLNEVELL